jgi:hypothetical protein
MLPLIQSDYRKQRRSIYDRLLFGPQVGQYFCQVVWSASIVAGTRVTQELSVSPDWSGRVCMQGRSLETKMAQARQADANEPA